MRSATYCAPGPVPVTELRAAAIIGSGSASFEMLRYLVEVLPVMVTPRWVRTLPTDSGPRRAPLPRRRAAHALDRRPDPRYRGTSRLDVRGHDEHLRRGGPSSSARRVARAGVVTAPVVALGRLGHTATSVARPAAGRQSRERGRRARFGRNRPAGSAGADLSRRGALGARPYRVTARHDELGGRRARRTRPGRPDADGSGLGRGYGAGGQTCGRDRCVSERHLPNHSRHRRRARYSSEWLWSIRGLVDKIVGGPGMRRSRRDQFDLRIGDALDFWRVEALERDHLVRLRAEMRLPGAAWLEWSLEPHGDRCEVRQVARFHPRGLWGRGLARCRPLPSVRVSCAPRRNPKGRGGTLDARLRRWHGSTMTRCRGATTRADISTSGRSSRFGRIAAELSDPVERILDLGSGTGQWSGRLARWFDVDVVGVEPSEGMRANAIDAVRVFAIAGQAEQIPLRADSVDAAWLSVVVHHFDDLDAAAREIRRVVRRGGRVLLRSAVPDLMPRDPTVVEECARARRDDGHGDLPRTLVPFVAEGHRHVSVARRSGRGVRRGRFRASCRRSGGRKAKPNRCASSGTVWPCGPTARWCRYRKTSGNGVWLGSTSWSMRRWSPLGWSPRLPFVTYG